MTTDDFNQDSPNTPLEPFEWMGSDISPRASFAGDVVTAAGGLRVLIEMLETSELEGYENILSNFQRGALYRAAVYIARSLNEDAGRILKYELENKSSQGRSAK